MYFQWNVTETAMDISAETYFALYCQGTSKFESAVTGFRKRQETISKRKCAIEARVKENDKRLERAESEMKDVQKICSIPEVNYQI